MFLSSEYERAQWVEALKVLQEKLPPNTSQAHTMSMVELQGWVTSCRKFLKTNMGSFLMRSTRDEPLLIGDLHLAVGSLGGLTRPTACFVVVEVDSYGHYFRKAKTRMISDAMEPAWNDEFIIELEGSENLRLLVYEETANGIHLRGRAVLELSRAWLGPHYAEQRVAMADVVLTCKMKFAAFEETIRRVPTSKPAGLFKTPITQTTKKEKRAVPFIITSAVREVERRGIAEVGVLSQSFQNIILTTQVGIFLYILSPGWHLPSERFRGGHGSIETRLREQPIRGGAVAQGVRHPRRCWHSQTIPQVNILLKVQSGNQPELLYLFRDLPECIFTSEAYPKLFEAYAIQDPEQRSRTYLHLFSQLPQNPSQACIVFLIEHLVRVAALDGQNKMSLHNLATVFGPTMLHAGPGRGNPAELLASSTRY